MKRTILALLFVVAMSAIYTMSGVQPMQVARARIEQFYDNNNNLTVSIEAPDDWNSGTASATIANLDWRGSGLATTTNDGTAFFAMINYCIFYLL